MFDLPKQDLQMDSNLTNGLVMVGGSADSARGRQPVLHRRRRRHLTFVAGADDERAGRAPGR